MNFRKNIQQQETGFQMAPMVDVVFLLLLFFMVASVYAQWETKIGIEVPTAGDADARTPQEILINIDKEGQLWVNGFILSRFMLESNLKKMSRIRSGQPIIIRADKKTDYEHVISVLDVCRQADIWNVSFATLPPKKNAVAPTP